jgi:hypothetical protein
MHGDDALWPFSSRIEAAREEVVAALFHVGYFGPFGMDVFVYAGANGVRLRAPSEINARYTMGFRCGFPTWPSPGLKA